MLTRYRLLRTRNTPRSGHRRIVPRVARPKPRSVTASPTRSATRRAGSRITGRDTTWRGLHGGRAATQSKQTHHAARMLTGEEIPSATWTRRAPRIHTPTVRNTVVATRKEHLIRSRNTRRRLTKQRRNPHPQLPRPLRRHQPPHPHLPHLHPPHPQPPRQKVPHQR